MHVRYLEREVESFIRKIKNKYKILAIVGPRQTGKTTLIKHLFPGYRYYNLEDLDTFERINQDPKSLINKENLPFILDEVQKVPKLFSQLQVLADSVSKNGQIILSGSSHLLMLKNISQSLAGRVALIVLLPFTLRELRLNAIDFNKINDAIILGGYPGVVAQYLKRADSGVGSYVLGALQTDEIEFFYRNYVQTYLYKDILELLKIRDSVAFLKFLKHLAYRSGQLVNLQDIATLIGKTHTTVKSWLEVLNITFVTFSLPPFFKNYGKRLIKTPKIYFFDTGLLSYLSDFLNVEDVVFHPLYGQLFENFVVADYIKTAYHLGKDPHAYFWRNASGIEIDLLINQKGKVHAIEIKAASTFRSDFLKPLDYIKGLDDKIETYLIYRGEQGFRVRNHKVVPVTRLNKLWEEILL